MPGAELRCIPPASASDSSALNESVQLDLNLQRQLEEDVARIFDESIYSDIEVVCGKLKILTHSCILKARTNNFYCKLESILHVNISRSTFDEIYSFISDTYTECDILNQEKDILKYLKSVPLNAKKRQESDRLEVFSTPKCVTPSAERSIIKSISSSPSTEITKEYYALVPIEGNLLEKELIEQDVLSNAFQSIINLQKGELIDNKKIQCNKPTSLALLSSHTSEATKYINNCNISSTNNLRYDYDKKLILNSNLATQQNNNTNSSLKPNKSIEITTYNTCELVYKPIETIYSPDSLITDDPSSASDYLSAAFSFSPGASSVATARLNVENNTKMENNTSSDSGLENTGLLESLTSHKDVTLTDMSLTESTLQDFITDYSSNYHESASSPVIEKESAPTTQLETSSDLVNTTQFANNDLNFDNPSQQKDVANCNSSKHEKQRQNEEIVILESSSLSSETGSWESVFPPKCAVKDICERQHGTENSSKEKEITSNFSDASSSLVQKSPFKSASCFIDAASLVDEEDGKINLVCDKKEVSQTEETLAAQSQPLSCSTNKSDLSPNDWSENDNEDSLEQLRNKDPDSIQKDLSPTIFEMTPITEDSLCTNVFESSEKDSFAQNNVPEQSTSKESFSSSSTIFVSSTPHNSIMSLKASTLKHYESEESESDTTIASRDGQMSIKNLKKYHEASPIISGGASIEDHLPTVSSYTGSPSTRRKIENVPILSGAYVLPETEKPIKPMRPPSAPAWVVDMSSKPKDDADKMSTTSSQNKPSDKTCDALRNYSRFSSTSNNCNRSRSSVDSDSSDRSSHKFYIDFSSIPDPTPPKIPNDSEITSEKKNIFSMYIDFSEKPTKEMPSRLSSLNARKNNTETKTLSKIQNHKLESSNSPPGFIFERYESLCNDPNICISDIIQLSNTKNRKEEPKITYQSQSKSLSNDKTCQRNLESVIKEEGKDDRVNELFVKLSDLDKPMPKSDVTSMKIVDRPLDERMTRSIPENNWSTQNQTCVSRSNEVISSFHSENALSLNRLFPHLRNEFSRSMPGSLSSRTRSPLRLGTSSSPGDIEDQNSDGSEMSSVQSSFCRSIVENSTTEETSQASSLIGNCQSRLGQDLLRMFLEEIAPDVIVEVSGRRIKAHKCILSSRCQYFAGILSGGWVESAGNVITLPSFSFNVVHFALCHIYSGVSTIPDSISLLELATLADMLGLEGLKEAIMFTLKAKYCHHFHRPCTVCTAGVLECLTLSSAYGLDDLYRKCLKWIAKYFPVVWPTKAFATLPSELIEKCYQQIVIHFSLETIIDTAFDCGITVESLQSSRWAEAVARICRRLVHAAAHYIAPKLVTVLREVGSRPPNPPPSAVQALHECVAAAIEWAPPDECCRAYALLASVVRQLRTYRFAKPDLITNGNSNNVPGQDNLLYVHAPSWILQCEGALVRAAPRVCCTQAFIELPSELRKRLRELGCIMYGGQPALPGLSQVFHNKRSRSSKSLNSSATKSLDIDQMRASFVPYAPKPTTHVKANTMQSNISLHDPKKAHRTIPPRVRTTKAQEERAKFNLTKTTLSQERLNTRSSAKTSFENTKPRYLQPKIDPESKKLYSAKKIAPKIISSSESSRNSSPIQARNLRTSRLKARQENDVKTLSLSQDSLATGSRQRTPEPSTDSHSESQTSNKYATYTKTKHTSKGSIDTVKSARAPSTSTMPMVTNGKLRTKIPVYLNQISKVNMAGNNGKVHDSQRKASFSPRTSTSATTTSNSVSQQTRGKPLEKNLSCSLMNATKSSSAKMVTKVVKEATRSKIPPKNTKNTKSSAKRSQRRGENEPPVEIIPTMERSGTFLKDEPTFGNKTTNIDFNQ